MAKTARLRKLFREFRIVEFRFRLVARPVQMHATNAQLTVPLVPFHRAAIAADAEAVAVVAQFRARHDFRQRAVVHLTHENARAVVDFDFARPLIMRIIEIMRHDEAVHANRPCSRNPHNRSHRMGAVIRNRHPRPPMFRSGSQCHTVV